ncbi:diguanylate cyclase/phosphodiesterase with PAS/PAC sensor(s) [Sulfurimonas gotlandica GD1]|uniref:Diguanylate cyclase/phosphodiesterase with PAS/PAC sensor(S) n=1 Tax=Sulfurimonas gotlandica (strain DSM 19862 / JCM 16533 / GD1) TaxID=929558 RepID=B6BHH8_SULGG|nr:PAS domain S-box protein [Sulfurimonas gotlandica]EDZ63197.1 diguanylate cyclase/phosphodiesterase with PAS/PAC and GAF sensor [Sulfurimonas gotlandica GD1]EHP29975.1 diguanylate cyclase/phosphodiesterase with PAS/PAC sensor(s) [Sulfurimonas gotlandica GD1]
MKKTITFLANLGFWPFVIGFTVLAIIFSEIMAIIQSYWLTGEFFDTNLLTISFITPAIVGFIIFVLMAYLISHLKNLEDSKDEILFLQKETKDKLHIEKERARQYLDITGTMIVALDRDANVVLANKETCKALGYKSENDLLGKNWFKESLPDSVYETVKELFQDIIGGNIMPYKTYENELLFIDGKSRLIEWNNEHIKDINGNIIGVLSSGRDITESRKDEEKLKKSESYQRALLDSFPFLVWLKDTQSNFLAVNKSFAKAAGLDDSSKLIGKNDLDFFPKDLADAYRADDKAVMGTLKKKELEELIEYDGERKWFETYKAPILNKEGHLFGTVGFARDTTEYKQNKDRLKLSASVFTYSHEGIVITDVDNNIVDVNEAFMSITGYSKVEVLGKNPKIFQSGRNDDDFYKKMWKCLMQDGSWQGELWNKNKAGEEYAEHLTISAVYDDNQKVQNYVAIFTDITEQKAQQERLEHMAHYDMLTNLPNRVLFSDRMHQAIAQTARREQKIAVAYIDLDGFKEVNDRYGHDVGDKLLILLAERMSNLLREGDSISRVGGDEFVALLIDISDKESVISFLKRLLEVTSQAVEIDDLSLNVSASIGVTFYPQKELLDVDQIIRQADQAMYRAKLSGKNCYNIFDLQDYFIDA